MERRKNKRERKDEKKEKLQEIKGRNYIPSGKKKGNDSNVEKSHKSAHASPML